MNACVVPVIGEEMHWVNHPVDWTVDGLDGLTVKAGAKTDYFTDPQTNQPRNNAPGAFFAVDAPDVLLSAKLTVDFASDFDAGALFVYDRDDLWGKLCFEYSPRKEPMIVSVINRGTSDDCNGVVIDGNQVYLRVAKLGDVFAFHYSTDGRFWHFVRYFTLGPLQDLKLGFSAQSPTGEGCTVAFSEIAYSQERLQDRRSGV